MTKEIVTNLTPQGRSPEAVDTDAPTIAQLRQWALSQLHEQVDADALLCHALCCSRTHLLTWPERTVSSSQLEQLQSLVARRKAGEPIAHLTGEKEFWSLPLKVTTDTLIPRPETEHLVELALEQIPQNSPVNVVDLGTGTGAIALAIKSERPKAQVTACDQSSNALAVAQENAQRLGLTINFVQSDWFSALADERFDVIVSNPPYIAADDPHLRQGDLRFEPHTALVAGEDGLDDYRVIARQAFDRLNNEGVLLLEHGFEQAAALRQLLQTVGFKNIRCEQDYGGRDRVTVAKK